MKKTITPEQSEQIRIETIEDKNIQALESFVIDKYFYIYEGKGYELLAALRALEASQPGITMDDVLVKVNANLYSDKQHHRSITPKTFIERLTNEVIDLMNLFKSLTVLSS